MDSLKLTRRHPKERPFGGLIGALGRHPADASCRPPKGGLWVGILRMPLVGILRMPSRLFPSPFL